MALTLDDVLAESTLHLRPLVLDEADRRREVRWVAVTELADPRPFLAGGELVLTTGIRQRTATAQRQFVSRIVARGVAALGFGTGLTHAEVPPAVVDAARAAGLPLVEVPYETPFIAVDRYVADRILESHYGRFRDLLGMHDALARALLSGEGLSALTDVLHRQVGGDVGVVDHLGSVLASTPRKTGWPVEQVLRVRAGETLTPADGVGGLTVLPVAADGAVVAYLCVRSHGRAHDVLPYAVSLVGLELARRQAVLTGRRELLGQVVEDLVRGALAGEEAERRLAVFGLDPAEEHTVVLGLVDADEQAASRLRSLPWTVHPPVATALVGAHVAVIARSDQPVHELAHLMHSHLQRVGASPRIGIGGAYPGVAGLRWSFFEAREALGRGPGINDREPLSLTGLLLASQELPLRELGRDVLRPLLDFDAANGGELVGTLRAYLEADGNVREVADRLFVHRNTVRYRLAQVERLTGRSLSSTQDRVQLWLALHAVAVGRPSAT